MSTRHIGEKGEKYIYTVEPRYLEHVLSRTPRYLELVFVSLGFAIVLSTKAIPVNSNSA